MANDLLSRFESGAVANASFGHSAHLGVAIALLRSTSFVDAVSRYVRGIERLAAANPEKLNITVTVAFLSAIAERLHQAPDLTDAEFISRNPELTSREFLTRWYDHGRLWSPMARQAFLLPEPRSCGSIARS
jgi:hypothetical protein